MQKAVQGTVFRDVADDDILLLSDPMSADEPSGVPPPPKGKPAPRKRCDALLVTEDVRLLERLSAAFAHSPQFKLRSLQGRILELESSLSTVGLPDFLLVDVSKGDVLDINALDRLKKTHKTPIVAISSHIDQTIVRGLMRVKVDDWLPADCSPSEVQKACEKAMQARAEEDVRHAKCTTFFPANGGCGATTLAIQAAQLLGNQGKLPQSACLIDLNFQDGAIADYLDLSPAFQVSELSRVSGRLDRQMLDVMLTRHRSGLTVLAAPRVPGRFIDVDGDLIASVLGLLARSFDHLIIDLPRTWQPWTDNVIWGSDRIFVVSGFTIPALRQARLIADAISAKASLEANVSVLVNKFHEPLIGPGLSRKDAETMLSTRLGGFIPNLGGVVDDAINRGVPVSEIKAGNKIEKKLLQLLQGDDRVKKA